MNYYANIKTLPAGQLLPVVRTVAITGKTRNNNGVREAQGFCINPGANQGEVWFTREEII